MNRAQKNFNPATHYDEHYHITIRTSGNEVENYHCNHYSTVLELLMHSGKPQEVMIRSIHTCRQSNKWTWILLPQSDK